jgi:CheY-like chemotaxis protein
MFARGAEGERILIDPKHLIKEIRSIVQETFPRSISFESEFWPGLAFVRGDVTQIHQVLLNLCVNARDAMEEGGRIRMIAANEEVDEAKARLHPGAQVGPYVAITVADTGTGIHPEVLDRIFDPFFTTKPVGKGTGLGLSSAIGIVRSHNGFIEVKSELNRGTEFKVYLPAVEKNEERQDIGMESDAPRGAGLILVVDDEESICIITKATLESVGYDVVTASSGDAALKMYNARWKEVKAVITDFMMPGMDGAATLTALRQINPGVKVIVTSGLAENVDLNRIEALHAHAFLTKPYPASKLLTALHEIISEKK